MFAALRSVAGRVDVADPPEEFCLEFRIAGVVLLLHISHGVDRMRRGQIGVNDAVPQARPWVIALDFSIGIDDPVHGAISYGVGSDGDTCIVEEPDHLAIFSGISLRVTPVPDVCSCSVEQPVVVDPASCE